RNLAPPIIFAKADRAVRGKNRTSSRRQFTPYDPQFYPLSPTLLRRGLPLPPEGRRGALFGHLLLGPRLGEDDALASQSTGFPDSPALSRESRESGHSESRLDRIVGRRRQVRPRYHMSWGVEWRGSSGPIGGTFLGSRTI